MLNELKTMLSDPLFWKAVKSFLLDAFYFIAGIFAAFCVVYLLGPFIIVVPFALLAVFLILQKYDNLKEERKNTAK